MSRATLESLSWRYASRSARATLALLGGLAFDPGILSAPSEEPARPATPPFTIEQRSSAWWLVSPEGRPFFSLGVCVVTPGAARESFDPENPGYAAWQHYASPDLWAEATLRRLKAWRFTTIGGWSDLSVLRRPGEQDRWLTPVLHIGSTAGAPWWDMWDAAVIDRMEAVAREQILSVGAPRPSTSGCMPST